MKNQKKIKKRGFTLIETLIILGVLAILGTITAIVINPIERLRTARDTNRFADLRSVQKTLSLFKIDNPNLSFGSSSVVYVSLPDTDPNCSSWDLPPLPSGWSYSCKDQTNYKKVDGTGWIPVNLTVSTSNLGSGLSILPVDSANNSNNYFFYIYDPSSGTFELGATLEAERNKIAALNDGGVSPEFWELGTNLALYPTNSPYVLVKNESDHQVYNENNFKMYAYAASAGQVSFFTDTNKITGDNNFFWNNSTKYLGIGTNGPNYKLDVQGGQVNASGGLCINGNCKTDWNILWSTLTSFPSACPSGQYVSAVSSTLTCSTPSQVGGSYWLLSGSNLYASSTSWNVAVGTASPDANYKITTSGGGIKAESTSQPAGYFNSASGYGLIVNNGNVGIGTTNPGTKLDVNGTARMTGFQLGTTATAGYVLTTNASGVGTWQALPGGGIGGSGTLNYIPKFTATTTLGNSRIYDNGTNVGIGTAGPLSPLHISASIGNSGLGNLRLTRPDTTKENFIRFDDAGTAKWYVGTDDNTGPADNFAIIPASGVQAVRIKTDGNVGIGSANPGQKLTVAGTIQSTTGGFMFPDSTIQTTTAVSFANMQAFTSSGTWTRPANVSKVYVRVWGGGGGGRGSTSNGGAGSGSAFGGSVTAGGGSGGTNIAGGAGGTASAGTLRLSGGVGGFGYANEGGGSPLGASGGGSGVAGGIPGGGGGGYSSSGTNGAGGGGAYAEGTVTVTGNVTVTIGSGGAAGSAGAGAGASGLVIVYW
jgi:type II secretory pathway pseudopilin PulG